MGLSEETPAADAPVFTDLFQEDKEAPTTSAEVPPPGPAVLDVSRKGFTPVQDLLGPPKPYFADKDYYRKVLAGEGDPAKRVHELLTALGAATDPQEKSACRNRLIPAFWELLGNATRSIGSNMPIPKRLLFRFGLLSPTLISEDQRKLVAGTIVENKSGEPIHYMDEWLAKVASGAIATSAVDEVKQARRSEDQKVTDRIDKLEGQKTSELGLLQAKILRLEGIEQELLDHVANIVKHETREDLGGLKDCLNAAQRAALPKVVELLRSISSHDRDMSSSYRQIDQIAEELKALKGKAADMGTGESVTDTRSIVSELGSVRQMHKLCCGRQGNHFPILYQPYFRPNPKECAIRENVINLLAKVETLDPGLFLRTFKGQETRIVPHFILLPCYGDNGICWEPFERKNRSSSRGRVALPMFPKDAPYAVIYAMGDLRWQVAKERAQHYWMEEGITGKYYQWFESSKQKGDVKEAFIRDYILWITRESEGQQKLEKEIRGVFWREMPFPQEVKDRLKNRGFAYSDLYKKDQNRARSDGY